MCVSEPFIDAVKDSVGLSDEWTLDKAAMLYTSMVINQEVLLLKVSTAYSRQHEIHKSHFSKNY